MIFISKSIFRKLVFWFIVLALILGFIPFLISFLEAEGYLQAWEMQYLRPYAYGSVEMSYLDVFWTGLGIFAAYFLLTYLFYVVLPLRKVTKQMQALLTGHKYKKIYTGRTDEIGILAHFFNEVTKNIGTLTGSIKENRRFSDELGAAAELQESILPTETPAIPGLSVVTKTRPAAEVGGDSFDFIELEGKTYMYVGDVTGHGVPAGLVMTMVHALIRVFAGMKKSAYEVIVETNKHLKQYIRENMFMTMVLLSWDHKDKSMSYVGAGHEYLLVFRAATGKCERIKSGGIALGMLADNAEQVKEEKLELADGDFILIFSDGIVEAKNKAGEMYGIDRLQEKFALYAAQYELAEVHRHIAIDFADFAGDSTQEDDITLMIIKRGEETAKASSTDWVGQKMQPEANPKNTKA